MNPLDYVIGATEFKFRPGRTTVVPWDYDLPLPPGTIKYCNLFNENYDKQSAEERAKYGPYLTATDVAEKYGEGVIDPDGPGWNLNLKEQFERARKQSAWAVELDNADAHELRHVMRAIAAAEGFGLRVAIKNPGLKYGGQDATQAVAHPAVVRMIVEKGAGSPGEMVALRQRAGKRDLPVCFVAFGSGRAWGNAVAAEINSAPSVYANMSATFDFHNEEYGGDITDLALPSVAAIPPTPIERPDMAEQDPPWIKTARGFIGTQEVPGSGDNPLILQWPGIIAAKFPNAGGLNSYCAQYTNDDIAWCGLFTGVCFSINGIMPVFGAGDLQRFLWAQAWKGFGVRLDAPRMGCVAVLARHVGFYVGEEGGSYLILGGNQSDGVNIKRFAKGAIEEFRWPDAIAAQPSAIPLVRASASSINLRRRMAKAIVDFEARRDSQGRLEVYQLPAGDGGGTYEVAGINDRYHPTEAAHLAGLIGQGRYDEAETYVADFIVAYTDVVSSWSDDAGVEFNQRDCAFNRGPTGAARIFQRALGVEEDGEVGPITLAASAASDAAILITRLRAARESYERNPVGRDETSQFWRGLVSRWNNVLTLARRFSAEAPVEIIPPQPSGKPMPSDAPTKFNPVVEDAIARIRPILEEFLAVAQSRGPTVEQMQDDIIVRLGGTPPKRSTVRLLTGPSSNTGGTAAPTVPTAPATSVLPGFAGGSVISGIIGALMGGQVIGTPFGMGADPTLGGTIGGIAALLSPLLGAAGAGGGLLRVLGAVGPAISALASAAKAKPSP